MKSYLTTYFYRTSFLFKSSKVSLFLMLYSDKQIMEKYKQEKMTISWIWITNIYFIKLNVFFLVIKHTYCVVCINIFSVKGMHIMYCDLGISTSWSIYGVGIDAWVFIFSVNCTKPIKWVHILNFVVDWTLFYARFIHWFFLFCQILKYKSHACPFKKIHKALLSYMLQILQTLHNQNIDI